MAKPDVEKAQALIAQLARQASVTGDAIGFRTQAADIVGDFGKAAMEAASHDPRLEAARAATDATVARLAGGQARQDGTPSNVVRVNFRPHRTR